METGMLILVGLAVSTSVGFVISYFQYLASKESEPKKFPTYLSFAREKSGLNYYLVVEERRKKEELAQKIEWP